jgi:prophage regulatory protein
LHQNSEYFVKVVASVISNSASENGALTDRILRIREVEKITGLSNTTIWRERQRGTFPEPVKISVGRHGWRESDINAWLNSRLPIKGK